MNFPVTMQRTLHWKSVHVVQFLIFLIEKPLLLNKNEKLYFIFYYINTCQSHAFRTKNDFENMSENGEFKIEIRLNTNML